MQVTKIKKKEEVQYIYIFQKIQYLYHRKSNSKNIIKIELIMGLFL